VRVKHGWNGAAKKPADGPAAAKQPGIPSHESRAPKKKGNKEPEPAMEEVDVGETSSIREAERGENSYYLPCLDGATPATFDGIAMIKASL
jgi:hypothetical protein